MVQGSHEVLAVEVTHLGNTKDEMASLVVLRKRAQLRLGLCVGFEHHEDLYEAADWTI